MSQTVKCKLNDLVKISYHELFSNESFPAIVEIINITENLWTLGISGLLEAQSVNSVQYTGKIVYPEDSDSRELTFFGFSIIKNFGIITLDELIEKYPEHLI